MKWYKWFSALVFIVTLNIVLGISVGNISMWVLDGAWWCLVTPYINSIEGE